MLDNIASIIGSCVGSLGGAVIGSVVGGLGGSIIGSYIGSLGGSIIGSYLGSYFDTFWSEHIYAYSYADKGHPMKSAAPFD